MAFENVFGNIDFQAPARAARADQATLLDAIGQGIGNYQRGQQIDMQRRQLEQKKFDLQKMAEQGAMELATVGTTSPENIGALKAWQAFQGDKVDMLGNVIPPPNVLSRLTQVAGGNVRPVDETAAFNQPMDLADVENALGVSVEPLPSNQYITGAQGQGSEAAAGVPVDQIKPRLTRTGQTPPLPSNASVQDVQNYFQQNQGFKAPAGSGAYGKKSEIDFAKDMAKLSFEDQIKTANEEIKTEKGKKTVQSVLDRMSQINEELKARGAVISSDGDGISNAAKYMANTPIGQSLRKMQDPEVQAYAEEYRALQSTLLPFYASAAGLGAKSLDSEGERKSILDSFGSPEGIYESNARQLQNLRDVFDIKDGYSGIKAPDMPQGMDAKLKRYQELMKRKGQGK